MANVAGSTASASDGNGSNATADDASASGTTIELARSKSTLVDLFVGARGIYVLFTNEVRLLDHQGALLKSLALDDSPSVSGSFEDERLTITSGSVIKTYDAQLEVLHAFAAPTGCALVARFSKERILCATWYYGYTVLDGTSGTVLSGPDYLFFSGPPLIRIPGSDEFVLNGGKSPLSNISMLRLTTDNHVSFLDEATLQQVGLFNVHGFDGGSAPSLIGDSGQLVGLRTDCAGTAAGSHTSCFVSSPPLGIVPAGQQLAAIAPGPAAHEFFGLVDAINTADPMTCGQGCELELIDDLSGLVLRQRHVELAERTTNLLAFRWDEPAHALVLGVGDVTLETGNYRVVLQPF
jgi:hypothetical protein